jgi:hypothetical protein
MELDEASSCAACLGVVGERIGASTGVALFRINFHARTGQTLVLRQTTVVYPRTDRFACDAIVQWVLVFDGRQRSPVTIRAIPRPAIRARNSPTSTNHPMYVAFTMVPSTVQEHREVDRVFTIDIAGNSTE